jgi:hypothetical protein
MPGEANKKKILIESVRKLINLKLPNEEIVSHLQDVGIEEKQARELIKLAKRAPGEMEEKLEEEAKEETEEKEPRESEGEEAAGEKDIFLKKMAQKGQGEAEEHSLEEAFFEEPPEISLEEE